MRSDALAQAQLAVQKFAEEKEIARHLKTHFDAKSPLALQTVKTAYEKSSLPRNR